MARDNLSFFTIDGLYNETPRPPSWFEPYTAIGFTIASIVASFIYMLILDFKQAYIDVPKYLVKPEWFVRFGKTNVKAPLIELNSDGDYREALARGSQLYPDRPYRIPHHPNEWVIIPCNMIDQIKDLPESKLNFQQGSYDFFMGWHTAISSHDRIVVNLLRGGVNKIIDGVWPAVQEESLMAISQNIGPCEDWTEISLLAKSVNIVMAISQRVFVGEPLCRSKDWHKYIMEGTQNAFGSVPAMWEYNPWTLPYGAWRHAGLRSVRSSREQAKRLLKPVLDQRLADMDAPDFKPPPDLMQFVLDATADTGEGRDLDFQVHAILGIGRAALFTTGITIYQLLYDLAASPEYIEPLREELKEVLGDDVPLNRANIAKLVKLDSFIRESQRWGKFTLVQTLRKVMLSFTLPDGTELPAGTYIATDIHNANFNNSTLENPDVFDGFRFARLREQRGKEQQYQSVQTASDHLIYGIGTQACPGRFFAAHQLKVLLARFLMYYDFKLKDKKPGTGREGHPMEKASGVMTIPNGNIPFLFRKRF